MGRNGAQFVSLLVSGLKYGAWKRNIEVFLTRSDLLTRFAHEFNLVRSLEDPAVRVLVAKFLPEKGHGALIGAFLFDFPVEAEDAASRQIAQNLLEGVPQFVLTFRREELRRRIGLRIEAQSDVGHALHMIEVSS